MKRYFCFFLLFHPFWMSTYSRFDVPYVMHVFVKRHDAHNVSRSVFGRVKRAFVVLFCIFLFSFILIFAQSDRTKLTKVTNEIIFNSSSMPYVVFVSPFPSSNSVSSDFFQRFPSTSMVLVHCVWQSQIPSLAIAHDALACVYRFHLFLVATSSFSHGSLAAVAVYCARF